MKTNQGILLNQQSYWEKNRHWQDDIAKAGTEMLLSLKDVFHGIKLILLERNACT